MLEYDLKSQHKDGSDAYWHEYGQRAKRDGCRIIEVSPSKPEWIILCPACAKKKVSERV